MRFHSIRRIHVLLLLLAIVATLVVVQDATLVTSIAAPRKATMPNVLRDINYAGTDSHHQTLDLHLPVKPSKNSPLVVWIHGGGWRAGSKDRCPLAYLTEEGYTVASINYRLTDVAPFPAQIHDCKGAIRYLRAQAKKHGYDANRIGVGGGSAGGHLVALLGTTGDVKELEGDIGGNHEHSSRVQAVLDLYGPTDLYLIAKLVPAFVDLPNGPVYALMGGKPSERLDLAKQASPVHHVSADDAPLLMLHGSDDPIVQVSQSEFLRDAYVKQKLPAELIVLEGAAHGGPRFFDESSRKSQVEFFRRHLVEGK